MSTRVLSQMCQHSSIGYPVLEYRGPFFLKQSQHSSIVMEYSSIGVLSHRNTSILEYRLSNTRVFELLNPKYLPHSSVEIEHSSITFTFIEYSGVWLPLMLSTRVLISRTRVLHFMTSLEPETRVFHHFKQLTLEYYHIVLECSSKNYWTLHFSASSTRVVTSSVWSNTCKTLSKYSEA